MIRTILRRTSRDRGSLTGLTRFNVSIKLPFNASVRLIKSDRATRLKAVFPAASFNLALAGVRVIVEDRRDAITRANDFTNVFKVFCVEFNLIHNL